MALDRLSCAAAPDHKYHSLAQIKDSQNSYFKIPKTAGNEHQAITASPSIWRADRIRLFIRPLRHRMGLDQTSCFLAPPRVLCTQIINKETHEHARIHVKV